LLSGEKAIVVACASVGLRCKHKQLFAGFQIGVALRQSRGEYTSVQTGKINLANPVAEFKHIFLYPQMA
jgi:hypothetical protein